MSRPERGPVSRGPLLAGGAVLLVLLILLSINVRLMAQNWDTIRPLSPGKRAPGFALEAAGGGRVTLSALRGKAVLVAFWASWCEPCKRELPLLGRLQRELGSAGLVVLAVNVEGERDSAGLVAEKAGPEVRVLFDQGEIGRIYGVQTLPHVVLVDREGQVAYIHVGAGREEKLERRVRRALGLPPQEPTGGRGGS